MTEKREDGMTIAEINEELHALADYALTNSFLIENRPSDWTYNKAIQKTLESCRIEEEDKDARRKKRRM